MTTSKTKKPAPRPSVKSSTLRPRHLLDHPPIPAPPVTNYAGILEQIAQSLQDLVAQAKTIAGIEPLIDGLIDEVRAISTSMSTLSVSLEEYLKVVDEDDSEAHTDSERLDWLFKVGDAAQHDRAAIDAAMDKDVDEDDVVEEGKSDE